MAVGAHAALHMPHYRRKAFADIGCFCFHGHFCFCSRRDFETLLETLQFRLNLGIAGGILTNGHLQ